MRTMILAALLGGVLLVASAEAADSTGVEPTRVRPRLAAPT